MAPGIIAKGHSALRARDRQHGRSGRGRRRGDRTGSALNAGDQERTAGADRPRRPASGSSATASVDSPGRVGRQYSPHSWIAFPGASRASLRVAAGSRAGVAILDHWAVKVDVSSTPWSIRCQTRERPAPPRLRTVPDRGGRRRVRHGAAQRLYKAGLRSRRRHRCSESGRDPDHPNVVEVKPGQSQFSMAGLASLAHSDLLTQAVAFATANTDPLKDYGVTTREPRRAQRHRRGAAGRRRGPTWIRQRTHLGLGGADRVDPASVSTFACS